MFLKACLHTRNSPELSGQILLPRIIIYKYFGFLHQNGFDLSKVKNLKAVLAS
jgi:hypothetical protein